MWQPPHADTRARGFCYSRHMHRWDVSIAEAKQIQEALRSSVRLVPLVEQPRIIAGADISFARFSDRFKACVVTFTYPGLVEIERAFADMTVSFPYVPGYLSFREVPPIVRAFDMLREKPDLLMVDGHGIAHPRRVGVASHLGLALNIPTIGCAKSKLFGAGDEPGEETGCVSHVSDPKTGEVIGSYVRTKRRVKPIIVSAGHLVTRAEAVRIALSCVRGYRIPEPTRRAHVLVNEYRVGLA